MNPADPVLVTGASGFVGSAVARALVARGARVRALVRPTSRVAHLAGLDLDFAEGDLRDPASLRRALQGVRQLYHVAADYRLWTPDPAAMIASNVEGTRNLMAEARRAGVERIVYTSSVATLRVRPGGAPADETGALGEAEAVGAYKRSKVVAERLVEAMIAEGLPAVIVNPSTPVGPRDVKPTPTGRILVEAASGRMPAFVDTGLNVVHVDDVAEGHIAAMRHGRVGERYILGGQDATLAEILAAVARQTGRRPPRLRLPHGAVVPVALAAEAAARVTGREPFVTMDGLRMARRKMFFSSGKAERELGYTRAALRGGDPRRDRLVPRGRPASRLSGAVTAGPRPCASSA